MKLLRIKLPLLFIISVMIAIGACVKETYDMSKLSTKVDLRPGMALPVAHGNITIGDLIPTSDTIQLQDDSSLVLSIEMDTLFSMKANEVITIEDEDIGEAINSEYAIEDFSLDDIHVKASVSLVELANNLENTSDGDAIIAANNTTTFPSIPQQSAGTYEGNDSKKYDYTTYSEGDFNLTFKNTLTTTIDEITITIIDDNSPNGVFPDDFTFVNVAPGDSLTQTKPLNGITMYNPISFVVASVEISGGPCAQIDINNDSIKFITLMENLILERGRAAINRPEPKDSLTKQVIAPEDKNNLQLTYLTLNNGDINYNIDNNIGDTIVVKIEFPYTDNPDGTDFIADSIIVPPRTPRNGAISLANTITNLALGETNFNIADTFNTFVIAYTVKAAGKSKFIEFTPNDAVVYSFSFDNIEYSLIEGYFGKDTTTMDSVINMGIGGDGMLSRFEGGFKFTNPQINLNYFNSIGVPISFDMELAALIDGTRETAGGNRDLDVPTLNENPISVEEKSGALTFNENDDLDAIFRFPMPEKIEYDVNAFVNPGSINHNNFITPEGKMYLGMSMDIPLNLSSEGFTFKDTIALDIPVEITAEYAALGFNFENDFPFNVIIEVFAWDSAANKLYDKAVISDTLLKSSEIDNNGNVIAPSIFESNIDISSENFEIVMSSDHLIIHATIDTKDAQGVPQEVKIKTNYTVNFNVGIKGQAHITRLPSIGEDEDEE